MRTIVTACIALGCLAVAAPAAAIEPRIEVMVIAAPMDVARALVGPGGQDAAFGLGVYPPSRDPREFIRALGTGVVPAGERPDPKRFQAILQKRRVGIHVREAPGASVGAPAMAFRTILTEVEPDASSIGALTVWIVGTLDEARSVDLPESGPTFVLGFAETTPVLVAWVSTISSDLIIGHGIARRDGVLTPYDIGSMLLRPSEPSRAHVRPEDSLAYGGDFLHFVYLDGHGLPRIDNLAARFERDAHYGRGLTVATVFFALGGLLLALAFARARRAEIARRLVRGASVAPAGYIVGLFVPHGSWAVRAIPMAVLFALALAIPIADTRRFVGWVFIGTAAAVMVLCIAAALRPNREPALSLWGNPLTSWRFFGLRNHLAAFIAGGTLAGLLLLRARILVVIAGAVTALVVTGAPTLGANFIGVTTLAFGAAIGVLVLWRARAEWWHVAAAAVCALGATFLAFLSDARSPVSHGGRAAQTINSGGLDAGWDIFVERARLNYREVVDIPIPLAGPIAFVALTIALIGILIWAKRSRTLTPWMRAASAGVAAAAFAALFIEDSGFFTGGILSLYPGVILALWLVDGGEGATTHPQPG